MSDNIFTGCMPALMTPCTAQRKPDFDALVAKGRELIDIGMSAVVYCGSMGDWPLLTEAERQEGVARLVAAGIPTIVGTGAVNSREAVSHAAHAAKVGAQGLMVIPRVLSRGASADCAKSPLRGDSASRAKPAGGDLQQPLLRLRHPRRPVLRTAPRVPEPDRLQGIRRWCRPALRRRKHHLQGR